MSAWSGLRSALQSSVNSFCRVRSAQTRNVCTCTSFDATLKLTLRKTCPTTNSFSRSSRRWRSNSTTVWKWRNKNSSNRSSTITKSSEMPLKMTLISIMILCFQSLTLSTNVNSISWRRLSCKRNSESNARDSENYRSKTNSLKMWQRLPKQNRKCRMSFQMSKLVSRWSARRLLSKKALISKAILFLKLSRSKLQLPPTKISPSSWITKKICTWSIDPSLKSERTNSKQLIRLSHLQLIQNKIWSRFLQKLLKGENLAKTKLKQKKSRVSTCRLKMCNSQPKTISKPTDSK